MDLSSESLEKYLSCSYNHAANRQTRMLAVYDSNFTLCDYADTLNPNETFNKELLARAKRGLRSFLFFGLTEHQVLTRKLFLKVLGDRFKFGNQVKQREKSSAQEMLQKLDPLLLERIKKLNNLDLELYAYAEKLFFERLTFHKIV
jgi:hypothetical protein